MRTAILLFLLFALSIRCASSGYSPGGAKESGVQGITALRVEEKANGLLIIVPAENKFSDIRCWYDDGGIFSVTLYPSSDVPEWTGSPRDTGILLEYMPVSFPESVQLSFRIRYAVTSWNTYQDKETDDVFLSLFLDKNLPVDAGQKTQGAR